MGQYMESTCEVGASVTTHSIPCGCHILAIYCLCSGYLVGIYCRILCVQQVQPPHLSTLPMPALSLPFLPPWILLSSSSFPSSLHAAVCGAHVLPLPSFIAVAFIRKLVEGNDQLCHHNSQKATPW